MFLKYIRDDKSKVFKRRREGLPNRGEEIGKICREVTFIIWKNI